MSEKIIKKLEFVSKILLIVSVLWFFYFTYFNYENKFYCFGNQIDLFILAIPLIVSIIIEVIAIFILKKNNLPIKNPIQSYFKFLMIFLIFSFIIFAVLLTPASSRKKAIDARKESDLLQLYQAQDKFFKDNSRYATLKELEQKSYMQGIINETKTYNIIFDADTNLTTWTAQADIKQYEYEICSLKKGKNIFVCNEKGCKENTVLNP